MFVRFFTILLTCLIPFCAAAGQLTGSATYRERIAMPPNARFQAILYNISANNQPEIGRFEAPGDAGPPFAFTVEHADDAASQVGVYAIQAEIIWPDHAYVAVGAVLDGFPPESAGIDLVMVRPGPPPAGAGVTVLAAADAKVGSDVIIGAHGLHLPATFRGIVQTAAGAVDWNLSLWPDQTFQLVRTFSKGTAESQQRSSLGQWRADPTTNALILRDGAEAPLMVRTTGQGNLQVLDADTGHAFDGELMTDGILDPADLEGMLISGMMTYMADAAVLEECLSGTRFPVAQEGDYLALETAYLADQSGPDEALYVMFNGGIAMRQGMEGPVRQTVTVDQFNRTRPGITCERQKADASLKNTYWRLDILEGVPFPKDASQHEPHMVLEANEEGSYRAMLGCNRMRGTVILEESGVSFSPGLSTMMACPPPLDALELQFSQMMSQVAGYAIEGENLILRDNDQNTRAVFTAVYF